MLWAILALIVGFIFALVNILDRHVVTHELRNPIICTTINGFIAFILYSILTLASNSFTILNFKSSLWLIGAGIVLSTAIFFYYKALRAEEVSRVMALTEVDRLFILVLAAIFLHEAFTPQKYIGIALLLVGAFIISFKPTKGKKGKRKIIPITTILIILAAALFFALRTILVRAAALEVPFLSMIWWIGLGQFVFALCFLPFFIKEYKKYKIGTALIAGITLIDVFAMALFFLALSMAPATLVSALGCSQAMFVFLLALFITKINPSAIKEKVSIRILILKIIAIIMIISGSILIVT
ncbi:MAG: EamA family transporter [Candidatus Pacearchaeota archaeon]